MTAEVSAGKIGCYVGQPLVRLYQELEALLGLSFYWNDFSVDVLLVDGVDLTTVSGSPLAVVCGPVSGENPRLHRVEFPALGQEAKSLLLFGQPPGQASSPRLDELLHELRQVFRRELQVWLELPPVPWGYSYCMALTHDIDILSLKELPLGRTFLGYLYRSTLVNWRRLRSGKVTIKEFLAGLWQANKACAAKLGLGQDCWQKALNQLLELERSLQVRSSLYFMPEPGKPGKGIDIPRAPANRASHYEPEQYQEMLQALEQEGWEVGVHGIDAWHNAEDAAQELKQISQRTGRSDLGVRMHWLYFKSPDSFEALDKGGFLYDSTFGFNETVGFRAGTLQPYRPLNCEHLWELPLHIQDGALLAEEHLNLNREQAYSLVQPILASARRFGGMVSLLWHNQSFTAPRFWGDVYVRLIQQAQKEGAWIAIPRDILGWFYLRRQSRLSLHQEGRLWKIHWQGVRGDGLPPGRIRLYCPTERILAVTGDFELGEGYIDMPVQEMLQIEFEGDG